MFIFIAGLRLLTRWELPVVETTLFGSKVLLFKLPLYAILFSVEELNFTIIVEFILERVAFIATALMLFRAVIPAEVAAAPCPLTYSMYCYC